MQGCQEDVLNEKGFGEILAISRCQDIRCKMLALKGSEATNRE